jgi:putative membrane protein
MKTMTKLLCALVLAAPVAAAADPGTKPVTAAPKISELEIQVMAHQHAVNQTEIAMGKLAQANGSAGVKTYGATLVKDHTQGDKDVVALAVEKSVAKIPADMAISESDKKADADMTAKMKAMKGAAFDKMFLDMMAAAHDRELTKIEADTAVTSDPDLKALLQKTKPVLQQHSDTAKSLQKTVTSSAEK